VVRNEAPAVRPADPPVVADAASVPVADPASVQVDPATPPVVVAAAASESDAVEVEFYTPYEATRNDITIPAALGDDYYAVGATHRADHQD
jgi:hypothetical protein